MEMEALRTKVKELEAENARLKATRAAIYKMYIESGGEGKGGNAFTRVKVFEALQLSADADRDKKEPAPKSRGNAKKPDDAAPDARADEVKAEPDEVKAEPESREKAEKEQRLLKCIERWAKLLFTVTRESQVSRAAFTFTVNHM